MIRWDNTLWLLKPEEFEQLPDGTELKSISGDRVVKGQDYIDQDVRFGYLAFGVENPFEHAQSELFTTFKLKG